MVLAIRLCFGVPETDKTCSRVLCINPLLVHHIPRNIEFNLLTYRYSPNPESTLFISDLYQQRFPVIYCSVEVKYDTVPDKIPLTTTNTNIPMPTAGTVHPSKIV